MDDPVSPSSAGKYLRCARRWAYRYIDGIKEPTSVGQARGIEVHAGLEAFLRHGRKSKNLLIRSMIPKLPRGRVVDVEAKLERGAWFGYIDLLYEHAVGRSDRSGLVVGVSDHKTCKTFRYLPGGPVEPPLAENLQANVYAYLALGEYDQNTVPLHWTYGKTKDAPTVRVITATLERSVVEDRIGHLDETVIAPIKLLRKNRPDAKDVEPNPNACGDFGGCTYRDICTLTPIQRARSLMSDTGTPQPWYATVGTPAAQGTLATAPVTPGAPPAPVAAPSAPPPVQPYNWAQAAGGPATGVNRPPAAAQPTPPPAHAAPSAPPPVPPTQPPAHAAPPPVPPTQPPAQPAPPPAVAPTRGGCGYTLLVDCDANTDTVDAAFIFRTAARAVEAREGVQDYGDQGYKGNAKLRAAVTTILDHSEYGPGTFIRVSSQTPEGATCMNELRARAGMIVK